jgi:hypothetical protein
MKQTKPYGRAFTTSTGRTSDPPQAQARSVDIPLPIPAETDLERPALDIGEKFSSAMEPTGPMPLSIRILAYTASAIVATASYIWIRDSLFAQNLVTMVTNKETVMVCLEGNMQYRDWSLWDRLAGNGYFVCSDWKVQTRFGSMPRF